MGWIGRADLTKSDCSAAPGSTDLTGIASKTKICISRLVTAMKYSLFCGNILCVLIYREHFVIKLWGAYEICD